MITLLNRTRLLNWMFAPKAMGKRGKFIWTLMDVKVLHRHESFGRSPLYRYFVRFTCSIGGGRVMEAFHSIITLSPDVRVAIDEFFTNKYTRETLTHDHTSQ